MARKGKVTINRELCKGCLLCVRACPKGVLGKDSAANAQGSYPARVVREDQCIACAACFAVCPDVCIEVYELEGEGL